MTGRASHILLAALIATGSTLASVAFAQAPYQEDVQEDAVFAEPLILRGTQATGEEPAAPRTATMAPTRGTVRPAVNEPVALEIRSPLGALDAEPGPLPEDEWFPPAEGVDPFSPIGLRLGTMTIYPSVTQSVGYDTNPARTASGGRGDTFSRTEAGLDIESDWSRHLFTARLRGSYDAFRRERDQNRTAFDAAVQLNLDITRFTRLTLESGLNLAGERPGSPDLTAPVVGRPLINNYFAAASLTQDVNRLQFRLRGVVGRTEHENARLRDAGVLSQRDRDLTRLESTFRTSYEVHPGLLPFFELALDRRNYDRRISADGLRRSSRGLTGRIGTTFELTRTLVGEASIGYQSRRYDDANLSRLDGVIGDAALEWSLSPVTTVNLSAASRLGETTVAGANGTRTRRIALDIRHDLRRRLTINGGVAFEHTTYGGSSQRERSFIGTTGLAYDFNRAMALTGNIRHERTWSTQAGTGFAANVYLVGLQFRR